MKIFIIHGWTYRLDKWQAFVELLEQAGHEPVLLRVPGLTAPSDQVWTIDSYVDWLRQQIGHETAPVVIGHSNGGRISLAYCNKYPDHLGRLFLIDSAGVPQRSLLPKIKLATLRLLSKIGKPLAAIPPLRRLFYKVIGAHDYNDAPPNMKQTMSNMLAADKQLDPAAVTVPTVIIWGRDDSVTPLSNGQVLHQQIKGSELHIIDEARHAPMATAPAAVAKIVLDALGAPHA